LHPDYSIGKGDLGGCYLNENQNHLILLFLNSHPEIH